jgi:predicted TIM-barrel fold metal-dependent hydrolase
MAACTMGALRAVLWRWPAWLALAGLVACGRPPAVATVADGSPSTVAGATYKRPAVIDFHGHLSLDGVERIREILATNGIERMVNLSGGSGSRGTTQWEMARELSRQLQGRIINFALAGWRDFGEPGWAEREAASLQRAVDEFGFAGLKVPKGLGLGYTDPEGRLIAPDDPRIGPLWRKAGELGVPVCIHIADPRAFWWPVSPKNERWDELGVHPYWAYGVIPAALLAQLPPQMQQAIAERPKVASWAALLQQAERLYRNHRQTLFVAVHFGNAAEDLDYVDGLLARNPNVWIDVAARVGEFGRHPAQKVHEFFVKWQDRVVFGTDIGIGADGLMLGSNGEKEPQMADVKPFYAAHWRYFETRDRAIAHPAPIQGRWTVDAIGLPPAVLDKLYRDNALRLLDRAAVRKSLAALPAAPPAAVPAPHDPTPAWAAEPL